MNFLHFDESNVIGTLLGVNLSPFVVPLLNSIELASELDNLLLLLGFLLLVLFDAAVQVGLAILSLNLLPHCESHTALVKSLVGGDGHFDFITNAQ
jgi:hypothetical protein